MLVYWHLANGLYSSDDNYMIFLYECVRKTSEIIKPLYDIFYVLKLIPFFVLTLLIVIFWKIRNHVVIFFLFTLLSHIFLSTFGFYPFENRLILYFAPFITYMIVYVCSSVKYSVLLITTLLFSNGISHMRKPNYPFETDNTKQYLQDLERQKFNCVYVRGGSYFIATFYAKSLNLKIKPILLTEPVIVDSTIPILVTSYRYHDFNDNLLEMYYVHNTLYNYFNSKQISGTYLLMPKY